MTAKKSNARIVVRARLGLPSADTDRYREKIFGTRSITFTVFRRDTFSSKYIDAEPLQKMSRVDCRCPRSSNVRRERNVTYQTRIGGNRSRAPAALSRAPQG